MALPLPKTSLTLIAGVFLFLLVPSHAFLLAVCALFLPPSLFFTGFSFHLGRVVAITFIFFLG